MAKVERPLARGDGENPKLVKVTCPDCGRHLAEVIAGAEVWCRACGRWVEAKTNTPTRGTKRAGRRRG